MKHIQLTNEEIKFILFNLASWEDPLYENVKEKLKKALENPEPDLNADKWRS